MYNLTQFDNLSHPYGFFEGLNTLSNQWISVLAIVAIYLIAFAVFKNYDTKTVFLGSSFISLIISFLMWGAKLISWEVISMVLLLLVVAIMIKLADARR